MAVEPLELSGTLRHDAGRWFVELEEAPPGLGSGEPVKLLLWDGRPMSVRSDFERIAARQQLERSVVAQGLRAEGALRTSKDKFLSKLLFTGDPNTP